MSTRQVTKASKVSGLFRESVCKNRYIITESKIKVCKTTVRPILTYPAGTKVAEKKTKQVLNNVETKQLTTIP